MICPRRNHGALDVLGDRALVRTGVVGGPAGAAVTADRAHAPGHVRGGEIAQPDSDLLQGGQSFRPSPRRTRRRRSGVVAGFDVRGSGERIEFDVRGKDVPATKLSSAWRFMASIPQTFDAVYFRPLTSSRPIPHAGRTASSYQFAPGLPLGQTAGGAARAVREGGVVAARPKRLVPRGCCRSVPACSRIRQRCEDAMPRSRPAERSEAGLGRLLGRERVRRQLRQPFRRTRPVATLTR